ncbi:MAG: hypothetical protein JWN44_5093 [Myxococcales bacterium]|nr:hypothetical protein [Myxococcales bacterium]
MRALAILALAAAGCAHAPRPRAIDPEPALAAWRQAIRAHDAHAAYALLSSSLRARISEPDFALQWKASEGDLSAQEEALHGRVAIRRATGQLADGRAWPLERDADGWRVAAARPLEPGGDTPEDALRRLVAAVELRDFDALLGLLAEPLRQSLELAVADRLGRLKALLRHAPIDSSGDHARVRYDQRYHLDLVRENGRWRIADFN